MTCIDGLFVQSNTSIKMKPDVHQDFTVILEDRHNKYVTMKLIQVHLLSGIELLSENMAFFTHSVITSNAKLNAVLVSVLIER